MKTLLYIFFFSALTFQSCAQKTAEGYSNINSDSLNKLMKDEHGILIDVRTPQEYAEGYIPGAILIDYLNENFEKGLDTLNKDLVYEVYCRSGGRSSNAAEIMMKKGFKNVYNLEGGIIEWKDKKYPIVK
jgi:phage shock protein E